MVFEDETTAILSISDFVTDAANSLFLATKYIFALSARDFYNCDVRDVLRVVLNNLRAPERLSAFHLNIDDGTCAAVNTPEYDVVGKLILYSFAVRLPLFQAIDGREGLSDSQIGSAYDTILLGAGHAAHNYVRETIDDNLRRIKKRRPMPPYSADWFKSYIYDKCPALAAINNRSLFFMGMVEPLFSLYSIRMEQELGRHILDLSARTRLI